MLHYLPYYYQDSKKVHFIMKKEAQQLITIDDAINKLLDEFFITTATADVGLPYWEKVCGLNTDENETEARRRQLIQLKLKRNTLTTASLRDTVAKYFELGSANVEIIEQFNTNIVRIILRGKKGQPSSFPQITHAVDEVIPAHLKVEYVFTYILWSDLDAYQLTYQTLDDEQITWDEFQIFDPNS